MNDLSSKKVLIVEDEEPIRNVLADALRNEGMQIGIAKDGQEGLLEAEQMHPDLILLDVLMPRMDGRTMLAELRKRAELKQIPVMFLTNLSEMQTISDVVEDGVPEYIVKSDWSIEEVVEKIKTQLQ